MIAGVREISSYRRLPCYTTGMHAIDSHCHPQFPAFDQDREALVQRTLERGIGMICVGTDMATSASAVELAKRYEGVWASVGEHPNEDTAAVSGPVGYEGLLGRKVVAVGEIGLDYYRAPEEGIRERQRIRFQAQLDMAERAKLPVILHCREAHEDMLGMLKARQSKGVVHSFNGTVQEARAYLELGLYIGLNAIVTFSRSYAAMVKSIPPDRILLETDSPYLAPSPHRGTRNEPLYIEEISQQIGSIRSEDSRALLEQAKHNTCILFTIH